MATAQSAVVDNHGFRYYDPEIGRYLTRDPAGYVDGPNVYLYVGNNPINHIDPEGLGENDVLANTDIPQKDGSVDHVEASYDSDTAKQEYDRSRTIAAPEGQKPPVLRAPIPGEKTVPRPRYSDWAEQHTPGTCDKLRKAEVARAFGDYETAEDYELQATLGLEFKALEIAALALASEYAAAGRSVWSLGPGPRGFAIESQLGGNLPAGFRVIDRFDGGVATSIKSIDPNAASYQNLQALGRRLNRSVDRLAGWTGQTTPYGGVVIQPGQVTAKTLQVAVPPRSISGAQQAVFNAAAQRAQSSSINLIVTPVR